MRDKNCFKFINDESGGNSSIQCQCYEHNQSEYEIDSGTAGFETPEENSLYENEQVSFWTEYDESDQGIPSEIESGEEFDFEPDSDEKAKTDEYEDLNDDADEYKDEIEASDGEYVSNFWNEYDRLEQDEDQCDNDQNENGHETSNEDKDDSENSTEYEPDAYEYDSEAKLNPKRFDKES